MVAAVGDGLVHGGIPFWVRWEPFDNGTSLFAALAELLKNMLFGDEASS